MELLWDHQRSTAFERILVISDEETSERLKEIFGVKLYAINSTGLASEAIKRVLAFEYELIICDISLTSFPTETFYLTVERLRPKLIKRFLLIGDHRYCSAIDFAREKHVVILWRPLQPHVLVETVDAMIKRSCLEEKSKFTSNERVEILHAFET